MDARKRRIEIFKQVQDGRLTLEEASQLLAAIDRGSEDEPKETTAAGNLPGGVPQAVPPQQPVFEELNSKKPNDPPVESHSPYEDDSRQTRGVDSVPPVVPAEVVSPRKQSPVWKGWWLLVFVPGILLIVAAANSMYEGFLAARLGWGFWLSFIPFTLGILLVWLGWEIRMARWLYIHIRQRPGARPQELTLSLPLPTGWISWLIRQARRFGFGPHFNGSDVRDVVEEIDQAVTADGPLQISIDDPRGGQIEIWMDGPK